MIFFLTLTGRGPLSIGRILNGKQYGGTELIFEKMEVLYAERNKRLEATTGSYSVTGDSLQYIYSVPVTKNHRNIRSKFLFHEFSITDIF